MAFRGLLNNAQVPRVEVLSTRVPSVPKYLECSSTLGRLLSVEVPSECPIREIIRIFFVPINNGVGVEYGI